MSDFMPYQLVLQSLFFFLFWKENVVQATISPKEVVSILATIISYIILIIFRGVKIAPLLTLMVGCFELTWMTMYLSLNTPT